MLVKAIQIIVIFFNLVLGMYVLSHATKDLSNRLFALMSLLAAMWTFSSYMNNASTLLIWLQSAYAFGALVISAGLAWTLSLTSSENKNREYFSIFLVALLFFIGSFLPDFIVTSYSKTSIESIPYGYPGWGLVWYAMFYLIEAGLILWMLYKAKQRSVDRIASNKFRNIYFGALTTLLITLCTSFIFPIFSIFPFGGMDNVGFLLFLFFVVYSITKYDLFKIQIIIIELIIFGLWIFMLIRIVLAYDFREMLVNCGTLAVIIILGILLVKNMFQNIEQRNKIEQLTQNLRKTYLAETLIDLNNDVEGCKKMK